jgi:DNA-binding transcriptional ArsR family regulator
VSGTGLTLTRQAPAATAATVTVDEETTPTGVARDLADAPALQDATITAIREALAGRTVSEVYDLVDEHDLTAADAAVDGLLAGIGRGNTRAAWRLLALLRRVGRGRSTTVDAHLLARLLALDDATTPTIVVHLDSTFRDARRSHREGIASLLAELSQGADVRVVGTGLTLRWLRNEHRERLPCVAKNFTTPPSQSTVVDARERLDPDGPHTATLRDLDAEPSDRATYAALVDTADISREGLRSRLSTLRDLGLVSEGVTTGDGTAVELRPAGSAYLDAVDEAVGRQTDLSGSVSEPCNVRNDAVCTTDAHGREEGEGTAAADRYRLANRHDVHYLSRPEAAPAASTPPKGGVAVVNYPVEPREDRGSPGWSYDTDADRLVVSAEWDNPMQYGVCLASALTDVRTWEQVLDEDRLADADLAGRLSEHKDLLRGCRCLGYLPDRVEDPTEYGRRLQEARDDLLALTGDLWRENYEMDTDEFRSLITREALGLVGTMTHLLDLAGVEIVREVRLPGYTRRFNRGRGDSGIDRNALVRNLATVAAIGSKYGEHSAYRQLLETRDDKVNQSPEAVVDAADPLGELIGSFVVVGDLSGRCDALADALRRGFGSPGEVRDDAPEFAVRIPVETDAGRPATAQVARRLCDSKRLDLTREAVSLFDAVARTPYDVADAVATLGKEATRRDIRESEVRYALAHVDAERLLSRGTPPTARRLVRALLDAKRPLSRAALVDRADVSRRSTYTHLPRLEALGLVEETDDGYRLALAFATDDERYADRLPWFITDDHAFLRDVVYEAALDLVDDVSRAGDSDDPVFGAWIDLPDDGVPDVSRVAEAWPWGDWILSTLRTLTATDDPPPTPSTTATFGAEIEQTPLTTADRPGETA